MGNVAITHIWSIPRLESFQVQLSQTLMGCEVPWPSQTFTFIHWLTDNSLSCIKLAPHDLWWSWQDCTLVRPGSCASWRSVGEDVTVPGASRCHFGVDCWRLALPCRGLSTLHLNPLIIDTWRKNHYKHYMCLTWERIRRRSNRCWAGVCEICYLDRKMMQMML